MPAVRKIKIPLADLFWLPFFSKGIQITLEQIRKSTTERNALLTYCECVCFHRKNPDKKLLAKVCYRAPKTWNDVFGDNDKCELLGTVRGDLRKPPHGTAGGFAYHFDDCETLVAKLLLQISQFEIDNPKTFSDRLSCFQNIDPGANVRHTMFLNRLLRERQQKKPRRFTKRELARIRRHNPKDWRGIVAAIEKRGKEMYARRLAEKPLPLSSKDLADAERHHAEWDEIDKAMRSNPGPIFYKEREQIVVGALGIITKKNKPEEKPKGDLSKTAHDTIRARGKILKNWPSISDFVPPELLSSKIESPKGR